MTSATSTPLVAPQPKRPLRVLVVEDSEFDAQMMLSWLRKGGYEITCERVESAEDLRRALQDRTWDLILADYNLPEFNAPAALAIVQQSELDVPFIIVSGGIGEDIAVAAMKAGAHDYLMKGNLNRLAVAVDRELREAANRASQRAAKLALQESEVRYRLLWETCPDAVILADARCLIHFANPAVRTVFGYAPEELVGKDLTLLQPALAVDPDHPRFEQYIAAESAADWRATETIGLRQDGAAITIEVSFSHMELNGERRFVGFIRDVTERKRAEAELREKQQQFAVAREIQQRLFPKAAPALLGFDIAGASHPADAAGGDYFDYLPMLHERLGVVVGDVTGHGVGPALLMAETRAYLRVLAGRREDVGEILTRTNGILAEDVGSERFVTLFLGCLDPKARTLVYASAGHPSGYILDRNNRVKHPLPRTGVPLGMRSDTPYASSKTFYVEPGDVVLLVSDGIEESMNASDEFFGAERMLDVIRANRHRRAEEIVRALYQSVRDFCGTAGQMDDVTLIVVRVLES